MALAIVHCRALVGLSAPPVTVEVHVAGGLPSMTVVGLPAAAVRESRDRVRAALQNSGFRVPPRRITVNLAPAELPKDGGRYDLAIAMGILQATEQLQANLQAIEFIAELSLSGELRGVCGLLPSALATRDSGRRLITAPANAAEVALVHDLDARMATDLGALCHWLEGGADLPPCPPAKAAPAARCADLADVRGQAQARRALEIAAAGGHSLLMCGPPGCGKSMLAQRLPGLLPPLPEAEALEVAAVRSLVSGGAPVSLPQRPFRAPHHTASAVALVGGGNPPRPGEISLAHRGVLFLDELPEFSRPVLEVLREPLENGHIIISRAARQVDFPAYFQLLAAMNPCPCGQLGNLQGDCHCSPQQVQRYRQRISGPLLDRIDLQLQMSPVSRKTLFHGDPDGEASAPVRERVCLARERQRQRQGRSNAELSAASLRQHCALDTAAQQVLEQAMQRLRLSARAIGRVQKLARTIADLAGCDRIGPTHIAEAVNYRQFDRAEP